MAVFNVTVTAEVTYEVEAEDADQAVTIVLEDEEDERVTWVDSEVFNTTAWEA
jgi:hypothetical protein